MQGNVPENSLRRSTQGCSSHAYEFGWFGLDELSCIVAVSYLHIVETRKRGFVFQGKLFSF